MPDRAIPVQLHANDPGADRHGIPVGREKADGKSMRAKAYAQCTAANERAKPPSATRNNALIMRRQR